MTSVYDEPWYKEQVAIAKRQNEEHLRLAEQYEKSFHACLDEICKADHDDDRDDGGGCGSATDHPVSRLADVLVEAGSHPDRSAALSYLLHSPHGAALLHRTHKAAKETPMTHSEFVQSVVKQYGIVALAKSMVRDEKSYGLDEPTFTALATAAAQCLYPNDRPDSAFSKLYESEESVRRACAIAKAMPFVADLAPVMVGGPDAMHEANDDTEQSEALAHLKQLGAQKWPTASEAQQFANAFTDPANRELAQRAHKRPAATTSFPFPR